MPFEPGVDTQSSHGSGMSTESVATLTQVEVFTLSIQIKERMVKRSIILGELSHF